MKDLDILRHSRINKRYLAWLLFPIFAVLEPFAPLIIYITTSFHSFGLNILKFHRRMNPPGGRNGMSKIKAILAETNGQ